MSARAPRVLAYSHDGFGLGHLRRNLRIVSGLRRLRPDLQSLLVTGAKSAQRLAAPFGLECLRLPPVVKVGSGRYVADDTDTPFDDVMRKRSALLTDAVREFGPDLLLVDRYPRGMHGELAGALGVHAARPRAAAVLGLRDILDSPRAIENEWREHRYNEAIRSHYDAVLCYGDRALFDPVAEYPLDPDAAGRIRFTGYLADDLPFSDPLEVRRKHCEHGQRFAVCTLGGGKDAAHIARSFLSAIELLGSRGWTGVLITGPYMESQDFIHLVRHPHAGHVRIVSMVDDLPSYLAAADAAVCMGGYNTSCELLGLAVPAVMVPRIHPRQEQLMRAERLAARGLLRWLHPERLSSRALADSVEAVAAGPRREMAARIGAIAHGGVQVSASHLAELLPDHRLDDVVDVRERRREAIVAGP